jgi:hypothetical protein
MPAVYENVIEIGTTYFTIRAWIRRDLKGPKPDQDRTLLHLALGDIRMWGDEMELAVKLADRFGDRINAIEVRLPEGGSIYYPDWP